MPSFWLGIVSFFCFRAFCTCCPLPGETNSASLVTRSRVYICSTACFVSMASKYAMPLFISSCPPPRSVQAWSAC